jgi:uncharacterized protein
MAIPENNHASGSCQQTLSASTLSVLVVYAVSDQQAWSKTVCLPKGACARDAVIQSGFIAQFPGIDWIQAGIGRFGLRCRAESVLEDGDRLEIYRPLKFDPKESRRRRALHREKQKDKGSPS